MAMDRDVAAWPRMLAGGGAAAAGLELSQGHNKPAHLTENMSKCHAGGNYHDITCFIFPGFHMKLRVCQ